MRQYISYILSLAILLTFTVAYSPAPVEATTNNYLAFSYTDDDDDDEKECDTLSGTAKAVVTGPDTASEKIIFKIGKKSYTADSTIRFSIVPQADGSLAALSTHFLVVKDKHNKSIGTISTNDTGTLIPISPGVFNLVSTLTIVSGTGKFKRSTGTINADAVLDFTTEPPSSSSVINGIVCKADD